MGGSALKIGLDLNVLVGTALLDMYAKTTGCLMDAVRVFESFSWKNDFMYNAMIAGFLQGKSALCCGNVREALDVFGEMRRKGLKFSKFTFSSIVRLVLVLDILSSLVDLYSFFGNIDDGLRCFEMTPKLDVVSWTSAIAGCVWNQQFENALYGCSKDWRQIQGYALKFGVANFTIVKNSQICMYAKSGDIDAALMTFQETENPDVVSWSVMICSYAQHGFAKEALRLFELMTISGIEPNQITLLGVLTACSHGGLIEEGLRHYETMKKDYGITANVKHSACIVDLLGRSGRLEEAHRFITDSGFEDDPVIWRAFAWCLQGP
ncbi:pentatricopeptide (PPR) repeat protein [Trifolium pratense]|uniref:Pentatricopeptide (PPR) repeat protein n=1 Tax=Trifolium pratense TaxID=57577 RepID=A0A2K3PDA0_TRIPR|nr:pentatricopeptide (PPR) repeat protein [Trifolium pratense]